MDAREFDRWIVAIARRPDRRAMLRLLAGGAFGALLWPLWGLAGLGLWRTRWRGGTRPTSLRQHIIALTS